MDISDEAAALEQADRERALAEHARRTKLHGKTAADSATHCLYCEEEIPQGRREAVPGVQTCIECQTIREKYHDY